MVPNEPLNRLHLAGLETQTRRNFTGDFRTEHRMVFRTAFANIMQKQRDIQHFSVQPLRQYSAGNRKLFDQFTALNRSQMADRLNGVLINRIGVIHIELHHGDNRFKFRNKCRQNAQLIHPPQSPLRIAMFQQNIGKDTNGLIRFAHGPINQMQVCRQKTHGIGMDQQTRAHGFLEHAQQVHFIFQKCLWIGNGQPVLQHTKARLQLRLSAQNPQQNRLFLNLRSLKSR